ncbi:AI-2E family transporter [Paenibacillus macquariensis]|uniref:Predicted PurR-regulated permease PerM n=1 Tax=Paenibacillus macquariensis TaxID=948756 RepID=A0ABY1KBB6_9BACL|nr:AI-2E family transporter [Paenibacillus macquariensis]MEC0094237.1 AI-2E family transporter [Paenibacillus macquariensis]OAB32131.1 AI-2E family transporter [Paenibacillus macquariensis subsp. macquariensis]SIR54972.1 Predicted PurR-regulated permease PerM [Paenibacillus macquariensis]
MTSFKESLQSPAVKRIVVLLTLVLALYAFRSMMNLLLITFIITYLVNRVHSFLTKNITKRFKIKGIVIVVILYALVLTVLTVGTIKYAPKLISQLNDLVQQVIAFYSKPFEPTDNKLMNYLMESARKIDVASYVDQGWDLIVKTISNIGTWSFNIGIALIMSLFFMLEKENVTQFSKKFKDSKFSYFYDELAYFGKKFVFSFGKVIEVQFLIAIINCLISTMFLWFMGFPNLFALSIMIFLLGLVPVVGVFVSLVPLCAIAFKIGGVIKVVYVLIMVAGLHAFEAYFMNPKFMSSKTHLPIFYTFTVLIVFEHFLGVWGLILGVPIFMFALDLLEVPVSAPEKKK